MSQVGITRRPQVSKKTSERGQSCCPHSRNTIGVTLKGNGQGRQGRTGEIKLLEGQGTSLLMWPRSRCCCTYFCCSTVYVCETDHCYRQYNAFRDNFFVYIFSYIDCAVNLRVEIGSACLYVAIAHNARFPPTCSSRGDGLSRCSWLVVRETDIL